MIKAFNSIKEIFLVFYQVLFVEAKERYEITEFYLEECGHNKKMETVLKVKDSQTQQNIINGLKKGKTINQASASIKKDKNSSPYEKLTKEKARLEKTIQHLEERLEIVSEILSGM